VLVANKRNYNRRRLFCSMAVTLVYRFFVSMDSSVVMQTGVAWRGVGI